MLQRRPKRARPWRRRPRPVRHSNDNIQSVAIEDLDCEYLVAVLRNEVSLTVAFQNSIAFDGLATDVVACRDYDELVDCIERHGEVTNSRLRPAAVNVGIFSIAECIVGGETMPESVSVTNHPFMQP